LTHYNIVFLLKHMGVVFYSRNRNKSKENYKTITSNWV